MVTGYKHSGYAESLMEFGTPRELRRCGGWILIRRIPGLPDLDGMGCYPLFACQDWSQLHADMEDLENELVSIALVADPFGEHDEALLHRCFQDVVRPFKEHFIIDLSRPLSDSVSKHHRRYAGRALRDLYIEKCEDPSQFINEWTDLYDNLIERHNIEGMLTFSRMSFAEQMKVPGLVMFRAVLKRKTVGIVLWFVQGDVGYYHLGAYSDMGYELRASFASFWFAINYFSANGLRWLNLGAGTGIQSDGTDGLSRFKRGWSTGTRTAYFCGRIFDHQRFMQIVKAKGITDTDYFPDYRKGEFG